MAKGRKSVESKWTHEKVMSLVFREMLIKTVWYHHTPITTAKMLSKGISFTAGTNAKCCSYVWKFLLKANIHLPCYSTSRKLSKWNKKNVQTKICLGIVYRGFIAPFWKLPKYSPTGKCMNILGMSIQWSTYYSEMPRNVLLTHATRMHSKCITLSERIYTQKSAFHMVP